MAVYCAYCGKKFVDAKALLNLAERCICSPNGFGKGPHKLYEGAEKKIYICKYCGKEFPTLLQMLSPAARCYNSPKGFAKGPHGPAR